MRQLNEWRRVSRRLFEPMSLLRAGGYYEFTTSMLPGIKLRSMGALYATGATAAYFTGKFTSAITRFPAENGAI